MLEYAEAAPMPPKNGHGSPSHFYKTFDGKFDRILREPAKGVRHGKRFLQVTRCAECWE